MKRWIARLRDESGAALITVLTMLAMMATLAVVVVDAANMSLRRTSNLVRMEQTRWYLLGAEAFAAARLGELRRRAETQRIDQADWQGRTFSFPLDDGVMRVTLYDGSNCFNVNALVQSSAEGAGVDTGGVLQFARLLDIAGVRSDRIALGAALADWIDRDAVPSPGGAEDGVRDGAPYRPANTLLADIGELGEVQGFNEEVVGSIRSLACVRPTVAQNRLNPNTLVTAQAALLAMVLPDISVEDARQIIRDRPAGGWQDLDAFFQHPRLVGLEMNDMRRASFSMDTTYYVMVATVEREDARETGAALIRMTGDGGVVVRRVFGAGQSERAL